MKKEKRRKLGKEENKLVNELIDLHEWRMKVPYLSEEDVIKAHVQKELLLKKIKEARLTHIMETSTLKGFELACFKADVKDVINAYKFIDDLENENGGNNLIYYLRSLVIRDEEALLDTSKDH